MAVQTKKHAYHIWGVALAGLLGAALQARLVNFCQMFRLMWGVPAEWANGVAGWDTLTSAACKALNPLAKTYRYLRLIGASGTTDGWMPITDTTMIANNWALTSGASYVTLDSRKLLDPGGAAVGGKTPAMLWLENAIAELDGKGFDGVVLDYWHPTMAAFSDTTPDGYPDTATWQAAWIPFITYICNGLAAAGYEVVGNMAGYLSQATPGSIYETQRALLDGVVYESPWFHTLSGNHRDQADQLIRAADLRDDPLDVWMADIGLSTSFSNYGSKHRYAYALFHCFADDFEHKFWGTNRSTAPYYDDEEVLFDFDMGNFTGAATQPVAGCYQRQFNNGTVDCMALVNTNEATSWSYVFTGSWRDPDGVLHSGTESIAARTGLLLKQEVSGSPSNFRRRRRKLGR